MLIISVIIVGAKHFYLNKLAINLDPAKNALPLHYVKRRILMTKYEKPMLLDLAKEIFTLGAACISGTKASGSATTIGCQDGADASGGGHGISCGTGGVAQSGCGVGTSGSVVVCSVGDSPTSGAASRGFLCLH